MPETAAIAEPVPAAGARRALVTLLVRALRPLVLLMLKQGMTAYEFNEIARWVFARTAMDKRHFAVGDRDVWSMTKSRAAVLTGFTRREVDRLTCMREPAIESARRAFHRLARVLEAWQSRDAYLDENGSPRDIPIKGQRSFESLARECGRDIPVRALLDEAVERGCVQRLGRDRVRFVHARTDGTDLSVEALERFGQRAEHFLSLMQGTLTESGPDAGFLEITGGPIAPEHREVLQQRITRLVKDFTGKIEQQVSAHPKSLVTDNTSRFVLGVYDGFV